MIPTVNTYEFMYENFTIYINSILRYNSNVRDWGFIVTARKGMVNVCINYIGGYHSRDMFNLISDMTLQQHKNLFDVLLERHLEEADYYSKGVDIYGEIHN